MSSGGGSGSGVTRVEPPQYQLPYLQSGLQRADQVYRGTSAGQNVVPFSPYTEASLAGTAARAAQGSPVTGAGQNYVQNTLQGGFLGSNPYLDATFNKAALATQNQLDSQYARAGRNIRAGEPVRAQQLNDLATNIYGEAYESERNRQHGVLPFVTGLANQDYFDLQQLGGVGSQIEGLAGQYANAPSNALDAYLGRVRGQDFGQTQTTRTPSNRAGSALGGAMMGSFLGPLGILGGGVLGGLLG